MSASAPEAAKSDNRSLGLRKNGNHHLKLCKGWCLLVAGKQWHAPKKAFRPGSGLTSYEQRAKERVARATMKAKEKELKDEKEAERQVRDTQNFGRHIYSGKLTSSSA
jgi:rRNA-processing protein CGR1